MKKNDGEEVEEDKFTCRVCGKETGVDEGDDMILICDKCAEKYDVDKIWNDFDNEKILEENLKLFDLAPYALNKAPKKNSGKKSSGKKSRERKIK